MTYLMTKRTLARLKSELKELRVKEKKWGQQLGESAGTDCDWHDNAAYDQALAEYATVSAGASKISEAVKLHQIIEPATSADSVGLGTKVKLLFGEAERTFTILGDFDSGTENSWVSIETPLAKAIMGKKVGDKAEVNGNKLEILEIGTGDYE